MQQKVVFYFIKNLLKVVFLLFLNINLRIDCLFFGQISECKMSSDKKSGS